MKRSEKAAVVAELGEKLRLAKLAVFTRTKGLTVAEANRLRRELREVRGECRVTKNTLARRAVRGTPYAPVERWLEGQTALVLGYDDPIAVAKVLARWADSDAEKFAIKGGMVEGEVLEAPAVVELAKTPPREVLRAKLLGLLQAPAARLVRLFAEPAARLVRGLAAREGQLKQ